MIWEIVTSLTSWNCASIYWYLWVCVMFWSVPDNECIIVDDAMQRHNTTVMLNCEGLFGFLVYNLNLCFEWIMFLYDISWVVRIKKSRNQWFVVVGVDVAYLRIIKVGMLLITTYIEAQIPSSTGIFWILYLKLTTGTNFDEAQNEYI